MMNSFRSKKVDAGMPMLVVVPTKEALAKSSCIFNTTKTLRKIRPVFKGLELRFGIGIVVTDRGSRMAPGDAEIGHEQGNGF